MASDRGLELFFWADVAEVEEIQQEEAAHSAKPNSQGRKKAPPKRYNLSGAHEETVLEWLQQPENEFMWHMGKEHYKDTALKVILICLIM